MNVAKGLRAERAVATRTRVFDAAVSLFAEKGYHQTSVDEIAKRAGVAKGTFFVHFATKDAVISELVAIQVRSTRRARARALANGADALERLRLTVLVLGKHAASSKPLSRAVLAASLESTRVGGDAAALFDDVFAEMVVDARAAQDAGLLAKEPDAETIASTLMGSYMGATLHFTSSPKSRPLMDVLRPLVEANLMGFRATPSKKVRKR